MTYRGRLLGVLVAASALSLGLAADASASISPTFSATTEPSATVISYAQGQSDDPPAVVTFYVPSGYTALLAQPEGEVVGQVTAKALAADLGNSLLPLNGPITAATGATTISSGGTQVPLSAAAQACTGSATHTAFWILNLTAAGQTLQVPAYVDDVPLTNPLTDIANDKITFCLPPPDVPAGTPGRAAFGAKLVNATLLSDVFSPAPAWYVWHAVVTPYTPNTGKANPAGTVEVQSIDRTPQELTLKAKAVPKKKKTVAVSGKLTAGGKGVSGADVTISIGKKNVGKATTKSGGAYKTTIVLPAASATLTASSTVASRPAGTCSPAFSPVPCGSISYASFSVTSAAVRVRT